MDDDERQQKLEAGKLKFAEFMKKKESGEKKKKRRKTSNQSSSNDATCTAGAQPSPTTSCRSSDTYSERDDLLSQADSESVPSECLSISKDEGDPKSFISDDLSLEDFPMTNNVDQKSKCDLIIARQRILELQELVDDKNETFGITMEENKDLKQQLSQIQQSLDSSLDGPTSLLDDDQINRQSVSDCQSIVEQYSKKIEEYKKALGQREEIIQQLTERLIATLASRDEVQKDATVQAESLAQEISLLKLQLKQATEVLLKQQTGSGISPQELLDARNHVLFLNQENARKDSLVQDLVAKLKKANSDMENLQESFELDIVQCQQKIHSLESEVHKDNVESENLEKEERVKDDVEYYKKKLEEALFEIEQYQLKSVSQGSGQLENIRILTEENEKLKFKLHEMQNQVQLIRSTNDFSPYLSHEEGKGDFYHNSDDSCSSLGSPSKQQGLIGKELFNLIDVKESEDEIADFDKIEPCFIDSVDAAKNRSSIYTLQEEVSYVESDSQTDATGEVVKSLEREGTFESDKVETSDVLLSVKEFESEKQALGSELVNLGRLLAEINELKGFLSDAQTSMSTIGIGVATLPEMEMKILDLEKDLNQEKLQKESIVENLEKVNLNNINLNNKIKILEETNIELKHYKDDIEKLEEFVNGRINIVYSFDTPIEATLNIVKMFQELRSQNQCLNSVLEESEYSKSQLEKSLIQLSEKYKSELQEKELALITVSERCLDNHLKNLEISNTAPTFEPAIDEETYSELERMSNALTEVQVLNSRIQEINEEKISLEHKLAQLSHDLEELVEANMELKAEKSRIENELTEKVDDLEDVKLDLEAHMDKLKMQLNLSDSAKEEFRREINLMTEKHDKWLLLTKDQLIEELPRHVVEEHRNCGASFLLLQEQLRMEVENKNAILAQLSYYSKRNEQHEKMYREILKRYQEMKDLVRQLWDDRDKLKRELMEAKYEKGSLEANVANLKESLADYVSSKESREICVKRVADLGGLSTDNMQPSGRRNFIGQEYDFQTSDVSEVYRQLISIFGETLLKNISQVANLKNLYKNLKPEAVHDKIDYFCSHPSEQYSLYKKVIENSRKTLKDLVWINNALEAVELDIQYEQSEMKNRATEIAQCQSQLSSFIDAVEAQSIVVRNVPDLENQSDTRSYKDCRFDLDESLCKKNDEDKKLMYQTSLQKLCDIEDDLKNALEKWNRLCVSYLEITVIKQKDVARLDNLRCHLAEAISNKESHDMCVKNISLLGALENEQVAKENDFENAFINSAANWDEPFQLPITPQPTETVQTDLTDDTHSQINTVQNLDGSETIVSDDSEDTKDSVHKTELFSDNSSSIKEDIEEFTDSCMSDDLYNILENQFLNGAGNDLLENAEALITLAEIDPNKNQEDKFETSGLTDNAQLLMELQNLQFDFVQKDIEIQTIKMESTVRESYLEMIHKEKLVMLREILTKEKLQSVYELRNNMNEFHEKVLFGVKMAMETEFSNSQAMMRQEYNEKLKEINNSYNEKLKSLETLAAETNLNENTKDFKDSVINAINEANLDAKIVEMNDKMHREMAKYKEEVSKRYSDHEKLAKEILEIQNQIQSQVSEKTVYGSETYTQTATPFFNVINDIAKETTDHLNKLIKRWSTSVSLKLDSLPKLETLLTPIANENDTSTDESVKIIALQNASVILDQKEKFLHEAKDAQDYIENYSCHLKKLLNAMENDYELILLKKEEIRRECTEIADKDTQTEALEKDTPNTVETELPVTEDLITKEEFWQVGNEDVDQIRKEIEEKYELEIVKLCSENAGKVKELIEKHNNEVKLLTEEMESVKARYNQSNDLRMEISHLIQDHQLEIENLEEQLKIVQSEACKGEADLKTLNEQCKSKVDALNEELEVAKQSFHQLGELRMQMSELIQDHQSEIANFDIQLKGSKNETNKLENQVAELNLVIADLNKLLLDKDNLHDSEIKELNQHHQHERSILECKLLESNERLQKDTSSLKAEFDLLKVNSKDERDSSVKIIKEAHSIEIQDLNSELKRLREKATELNILETTFSSNKLIYEFIVIKFVELCLQNSAKMNEEGIKLSAEKFTNNVIEQIQEFETSLPLADDLDGKILNLQQTLVLDLESLILDKQNEFGSKVVSEEIKEDSLLSLSAVEQLKLEIQQSLTTQRHENETLSSEIGILKNQIVELEYVNTSLQEDLVKANATKTEPKQTRDWLAGTELSAADIQTWQVHTAQTNSRLMNVLSDLVKTFVDTEQTIQNHLTNLGLSVHQSSDGGSLVDDENGPLSGTFHGSREDCTLSSLGDALPLEMCDDIADLTPRAWDAVTNAIGGIQQEPDTEGEDVVLACKANLWRASRRLRAAVDHVLTLLTELIENSHNQEITDLILKNHKLVVQLKEEHLSKSQLQEALNKAEEILATKSEDGSVFKLKSTGGDRSAVNISETSPKQVQCLRKSNEDIIEDTTTSESYSAILKRDIESLTNSGEVKEDWKQLLKRTHYLELALEEISNQKDEIAEEKQKEIDDLKEQMEAMEKQMQSNKRFIDEQAHEREQEQEDFYLELEKIKDSLRERERSQSNDGQLLGEVELLEQQLKLKSQSCEDLRDKMIEIESLIQSSNDKIKDLQEVISEMEDQLESKNKVNGDLNQELVALRDVLVEHEHIQTDMTNQIEELKVSLKKEYSDHIASLEEQLESKNQEMEQMAHCQTLMQEFRSQIHILDERLESKIRKLEHFSWHLSPGTSEENSLSDSKDHEDRMLLIQEGRVLSPRSIHGEEIKKLENKIDSLLNGTDEAMKRLKDSDTKIREMKFKSDELQTERSLLQQQLNDQLYQISTLKSRIEDARFDVKSKITTQELTQLQEDLTMEKEKVKELKLELESYKVNYPKLQKQIQEKGSNIAKLEDEIFKHSCEIENLVKENTDLKIQLKPHCKDPEITLVKELVTKSSNFPILKEAVIQTDLESAIVSTLQNDISNLKESLLGEEKLRSANNEEIKNLKIEVVKLNGIIEELTGKCGEQSGELNNRNLDLNKAIQNHQTELKTLSEEYKKLMEEKEKEISKLTLGKSDLKKLVALNTEKVEDNFRQKLDAESNALSATYEQSLNKIREQHERSMKELEDRLTESFNNEVLSIKATHNETLEEENTKWKKKMNESSNSHLSNQKFIFDDYEAQLEKLVRENKNFKASLEKYEQQLILKGNELKLVVGKCGILEDELERFRNNLLISRDSTPESDATVSSQATSTGDDGSLDSVKLPSHMQKLFDKVLKEGLEVLSLTERKQISHHVADEQNLNQNDRELWFKAKDQLLEEVKALKEILIVESQGNNDESIAVILQDFLKREKNRLLIELQTYSLKEGHQVLSTCKELEDKIYSLEDRQEATLKELYELVHSQLSKEKAGNLQMEQEIILLKDQVDKGAWQIKKQRDLLDYKVKQEKMLREEFQSSLEREQLNNEQLTLQVRQMRTRCSELEMAISMRQAEFQKVQNELDRARKETESYKSTCEAEKNHANALLQALEAERVNFSQIHMALDSEREHRKTLLSRDQQIINKLQASIDVQSYTESISSRTLSPELPRLRDESNSSANLVLSSMHHNSSSIVPVKEKCVKCGFYENMLVQERSNWKKHEETMNNLLQSAENEVAQLKQKMVLSNSSSKNDASSHRQKLLQVHWKYRKSEKHRMSLVYQKRYLLKLLQGYQKTESAALTVLTQMGVCTPSSSTQGSIYEGFAPNFHFDSLVSAPKKSKVIKFRSVVQFIIGTLRFRYLLDRSNQAQQFFIYGKQQQLATNEALPISNNASTIPKFAPYKEAYGLSHLFSSTSCSSSSSTSSKQLTNKIQHIIFEPSTVQIEKTVNNSSSSIKSDISNSDLTRGQRKLQECVIRLEHMHKALGLDG